MTTSIFKQLAAITVGTTVMFAAGQTMPSQAATIAYNFANTDKTLTGYFSFDQAAALDQLVEVSEGLKIVANYNGQTYTEQDDPLALVFTDTLGAIPPQQGLGLQFVIPGAFTVASDYFISANDETSSVTYTSTIPEPASVLGLSILGLGLLVGKKTQSFKASKTKA